MQISIPGQVVVLKKMLAGSATPKITPSRHCGNPYECIFFEYFTRDMPENWVMNLAGITQSKLNELTAMGINDIKDIPDSFPLSDIQERVRDCIIGKKEYISPELKSKLEDADYPTRETLSHLLQLIQAYLTGDQKRGDPSHHALQALRHDSEYAGNSGLI